MTPTAFDKIAQARRSWHKTVGERVLRGSGIVLALVAVSIGVAYGFYYGWEPGGPPASYRVSRSVSLAPKQVLLIASALDSSADGLAEAVRSYFGAHVTTVPPRELKIAAVSGSDCVIVFSNGGRADAGSRREVISAAVSAHVPVYWIGSGISEVAGLLGLASFEEDAERGLPRGSQLAYKGVELDAEGLPFLPGYPVDASSGVEVMATVRLHGAFIRPAVVRSARATYLAFSPLPEGGAAMALAVAIDLLGDALGRHAADPRVVFRLEDVNAVDYANGDRRFSRAAQQLVDAGFFLHVAVTPVMVDASGTLVADISSADDVLEFLRRHRYEAAIVQHGTRHHRNDPRNAGKPSGDAYEFFFDDDQTMGRPAAMRFALERLTEGRDALTKAGFAPLMFEAPHLEMSPGEEFSAQHLFPVMMHPPLFFGRSAEHFSVLVPWITERDGTVYAPSDVGYVDVFDEGSVGAILARLDQLKAILPDPIVVVFYHPFMIDKPGREGDLTTLIDGIGRRGYRPVNLLDQVEPVR